MSYTLICGKYLITVGRKQNFGIRQVTGGIITYVMI